MHTTTIVIRSSIVLVLALHMGCGSDTPPRIDAEASVRHTGARVAQAVATEAERVDRPEARDTPSDFGIPRITKIEPYYLWSEARTACDALARIGRPAVPMLIEQLRDPDVSIRLRAAHVLGRIGSDAEEAVPTLTEALYDDDDRVRREATRALGHIGPSAAQATPLLIEMMRQPADDVLE